MKDRTKGLIIIVVGVLCVSPDAVLVKFLGEGGADPWTIIFWKMLLSVPFSAGYALYDAGGFQSLFQSVWDGRFYYLAAIPVQASIDMGFTMSYVYTTAANALLLIGLNPLWSAVAGKFVLGDPLPIRTYVALVLSLACVLIILVPDVVERNRGGGVDSGMNTTDTDSSTTAWDNVTSSTNDDVESPESPTQHGPSPKGNVIALFTGFLLAAYIIICRKSQLSSKKINLVGAAALGATSSALVSLTIRRAQVSPGLFWQGPMYQFWLAEIGQGAGIGIVFIAMTVAPKYITAAEIGIFCLLEVVLGPLFVFFAYGDVPSRWTLIGGSLLLVVLAVHEAMPLLERANDTVRASFSKRRTLSSLNPTSVEVEGGGGSRSGEDGAVGTTTEAADGSKEDTEEDNEKPTGTDGAGDQHGSSVPVGSVTNGP